MQNKIIARAIKNAGGQSKFAEICGVKQSSVWRWLNGGSINAKYLCKIEAATKGAVTVKELAESVAIKD